MQTLLYKVGYCGLYLNMWTQSEVLLNTELWLCLYGQGLLKKEHKAVVRGGGCCSLSLFWTLSTVCFLVPSSLHFYWSKIYLEKIHIRPDCHNWRGEKKAIFTHLPPVGSEISYSYHSIKASLTKYSNSCCWTSGQCCSCPRGQSKDTSGGYRYIKWELGRKENII